MAEPKTFASLSSGLLARKGAAKPAMRPQGFGTGFNLGHEDLGWNDMGYDQPQQDLEPLPDHVPSSIAGLTPSPKPVVDIHGVDEEADPEEETAAEAEVEATPQILPTPVERQRAEIAARFSEPEQVPQEQPAEKEAPEAEVSAPAPVRSAAVVPIAGRRAPGAKGKAAFTLRLDPGRHLKLRLAAAMTHRSAQQIVTEALDQYLSATPELEALVDNVPAVVRGRS